MPAPRRFRVPNVPPLASGSHLNVHCPAPIAQHATPGLGTHTDDRFRFRLASLGALLVAILVTFTEPSWAIDETSTRSTSDPSTPPTPVAGWDFEKDFASRGQSDASTLVGHPVNLTGEPRWIAGPSPPDYPTFAPDNLAWELDGQGYVAIDDPHESSPFDFSLGDTLTIEAWIRPTEIREGQQAYLIGKGRTQRPHFAADNQNWALRLRGMSGQGSLSFLFRSRSMADSAGEFQRWNTHEGVPLDGRWHHVAVQFQFGRADSIRAILDGRPVSGSWDLGSQPEAAPVVDNDQVWIGSSMGGQAASSYRGGLDQVRLYRGPISLDDLSRAYVCTLPKLSREPISDELLGDDVVVEVLEGIGSGTDWQLSPGRITTQFRTDQFALVGVPAKYNLRGIRMDRTPASLVRLRGTVRLPSSGTLVLRSKNAARLWIGDQPVLETGFMSRNASGHEPVPELIPPRLPGEHPLPPGHQQQTLDLASLDPTLLETPQQIRLETLMGGPGLRSELGDLALLLRRSDDEFDQVVAPSPEADFSLTSAAWLAFERAQTLALRDLNQRERQRLAGEQRVVWQQRHERARAYVASLEPLEPPPSAVSHPIDAWIEAGLQQQGLKPQPLVDDRAFLRRLFLDTVGVTPTHAEVQEFLNDTDPDKRTRWIDRLLDDPRWADHWVSYWQDVLAENPGILKPSLNNTGPFRYWIHEAFLDNRPLDQFATELIRMEGSRYAGGPGGFEMATQNDVPMAAKGIVIGQAFLGINLTCARCHDAPGRDRPQRELFEMAALLEQRPIRLPATSSVPIDPAGRQPAVTVSLKPGTAIEGAWPFHEAAWSPDTAEIDAARPQTISDREQLATWLTAPENQRFSQVLVNRVWARWLGRGLIEPVDDWEIGHLDHPELLAWLGREFTAHNYDLKWLARCLLTSQTYQRARTDDRQGQRWFAGVTPRRMTPEQLVDSLHAMAGKPLDCEMLSLDPEGRRPASTFLNLGVPTRAWEMVALSNERDRPALALPQAQGVIDLLTAFGWRESRPQSRTAPDMTPQVLQPLIIANGNATHRLVQFSDDSWFTHWSLTADSPEHWLDGVSLRILGRYPTAEEQADWLALIAPGFEDRIRAGVQPQLTASRFRNAVSWSNHLHPDATSIKLQLEAEARAGDQPTERLQTDWRQRAEDVVWVLFNSPETVLVP